MKILSRLIVISFTFMIVLIYNFVVTPYEDAINNDLCSTVKLPVIMYHAFLKDTEAHGEFVISPEQFENDIKYILEKGYTPISLKDLSQYLEGKGNLPEKPIMITIDDGYYNNYLYAFPVAKQYGVKMIIAPIMKFSELYSQHEENNAYYSHITWEQGKEMVESGLVEFQNHTYDLHYNNNTRKGIRKNNNETNEQYEKMLYTDLYQAHHLITEKFGFTPISIAYPFGYYSKDADNVIKQFGYKISFSSESGINNISPSQSAQMLKRYNRPSGKSSLEFFDNIFNIAEGKK